AGPGTHGAGLWWQLFHSWHPRSRCTGGKAPARRGFQRRSHGICELSSGTALFRAGSDPSPGTHGHSPGRSDVTARPNKPRPALGGADAATKVGIADLLIASEIGAVQHDAAHFEHIAAPGKPEGRVGILLHEENSDAERIQFDNNLE